MSFVVRVAKRVSHAFLTFLAAITFTFVMIRQIPGGPVSYLRAQLMQEPGSSTRNLELVSEYLIVQPDEPITVQYVNYVTSVLSGDLGRSVWYQEPALDIVLGGLPWTLFYASISVLLSFAIAIVLGALIAYREQSTLDSAVSMTSVLLNSTPYYVVALLGLYILSFQYGLFPTGGRTSYGVEPAWTLGFLADATHHALLPILSLVITGTGMKVLLMRSNSISVLGEDYLRVARLRGLTESRIATRYVARNAILPMYTHLVLSIGFVFSGSTVLETIFNYRGIGYYVFEAIEATDYPLMMASFLVITIAIIVGIVIADLTYHLLDPRLGRANNGE